MAKKKVKYDYKKTLLKFGKAAFYVGLAGLVSVYGESSWYLALAPTLHALENWIKHRK